MGIYTYIYMQGHIDIYIYICFFVYRGIVWGIGPHNAELNGKETGDEMKTGIINGFVRISKDILNSLYYYPGVFTIGGWRVNIG